MLEGDRDLLQSVADLPDVVAVGGHPVEAGHTLGQLLTVTGELDVDLRPADGQERVRGNLAEEADPALAGEIRDQVRDLLADLAFPPSAPRRSLTRSA